ncbi:SusC/RagA family TonB-linked outer membrane protein [Chitinophaga sp. Hz27]|uniref:SusC/RagA family TonB-linked outer membrane protein n=1 Tax=Chitinophaga sp. Hz27 TaxID=3347169 RepID=UPI0035DB322A
MRKILFALVACLLTTVSLFAQRTISGKVTDNTGELLPGVSIVVKGTQKGTISNGKGIFTLTVPDNAKALVFSAVGLATQEVELGNSSVVNVSMKISERTINEVVISTGYGSVKRNKYTGASTVLSNKVVDAVPMGAFDQALQGRAPGVLVNSGSGQPGSSANVVIRGIQSISGSGIQPLYIVDGVPLPANDMATINPNDFESMTVLKDAASAALYGARGGVGVIVITTKRGKAGTNNFTVRSQVGVTTAPKPTNFDLMNSSQMLAYEEREKIAGTPGWNYSPLNPANAGLRQDQKDRYATMLDSMRNINSDWRDIVYRKGFSQMHEINASGGNDKSKYYFSAGVFDQKGMDLKSRLRRYTTRFNLDQTLGRLSIQFNNQLGYSISEFAEGEYLGNSARNVFQMVWRAKTYENPYNPDGSLNIGPSSNLALKQMADVLDAIQSSTLRDKQFKINSGLNIAFKILPSLTARNVVGIDVAADFTQRYVQAGSYYGTGAAFTEKKGIDMENTRVVANIVNTSSLVYAKTFGGRHDVEAGAYFEIVRNWQQGGGFTLYNLDPRLSLTGQGAGNLPTGGAASYSQPASSAKSGYGIRSYFGSLRYTYNDKYTVSGVIRRDGTSRILNPANKEITTWSSGFTWNAIKEDFLANNSILSDLRFRASYGIVPNIGSIATGTYSNGLVGVTNYMGSQLAGYGTVSFPGSTISGIAPVTPGNDNLKIEHIKKFNIGFDLAVLKDRVRFSADYYRNMTIDLFVKQPLSYTTGFSSLDINAGKMSNRGIELALSVDVVKQRDYGVTLGWNHAFNKNNIEDLGSVDQYVLGTFLIKKGLPFGSHYTYHYLGADPTTGKPMYEGADGKTVYDVSQAPQMAIFGSYVPKHTGGFTLDAHYKRLSLSALFSYQFDVVRSNNAWNFITRGTPGYQASLNASPDLINNQWQKPGDVKFYQSSQYDRGFTSSDLMDAKFLRFRSLNIAYVIPELAIKGTKLIKSAKVYVQANNLFVWSPWKGQDPEDNNNISLNEYPNPRIFTAGIDINF